MTAKIFLDPRLTLRPACWTDINTVAKLAHDVAEMEGDSLFVLRNENLSNVVQGSEWSVSRLK
jgi:hypothetical protein